MIFRSNILFMAVLALYILLGIGAPASASQLKQLTITHSNTYPPFSFINEQDEPRGYLIDLWKAFGEANNIRIEFKLVPWKESLALVRDGKADVHAGLFFNEERDQYLDFGPSIMEVRTDLYVDKSMPSGAATKHPVGVVRDGHAEFHMQSEYPDRQLLTFKSTKATVQAAKQKDVFVFVADQPTAIYYMRKASITSEFVDKSTLYSKQLKIAVIKGRQDILEQLENGWRNVDENLKTTIYNRWFVETSTIPDWVLPSATISLFAVLFAFIIRKIGQAMHKDD